MNMACLKFESGKFPLDPDTRSQLLSSPASLGVMTFWQASVENKMRFLLDLAWRLWGFVWLLLQNREIDWRQF
jgi:hypothetical protein